jgi:ATP-binding cassette subfamily B protein
MTKRLIERIFKDPDGDPVLIRRILGDQGRRNVPRYVMAFAMMAVVAACTAVSAWIIGTFINTAYIERDFQKIVMISGVTVIVFVIKGFAAYGSAVVLARIANSIQAENQARLFERLMSQNLAFFAERHSSEFVTRMQVGAAAVGGVLNLVVSTIGRDLLTLVFLVTVMVVADPVASLFGLLVAPPAIFVLRKLLRRARQIKRSEVGSAMQIVETLGETTQGVRVIKAFGLEPQFQARASIGIEAFRAAADKMARVTNRTSPLMEMLGGLAIAGIILYGGYKTLVLNAAPGDFFSFITAFLLAYEPAKRLARFNIDLAAALVGVRFLYEVLDAPATEPAEDGKPALAVSQGRVELADVEFRYRADEPVLRAISLTAEPGRTTAIVGLSGSGKSTIMNLLLRFYDVEAGRISIDGTDIRTVSRASLRRAFAYMGQDVFLFRGTIAENIGFGRPGATRAEIEDAARAANAHDFIMSFGEGYDTPVGEHGAALSGGQRQRIAIARALVRNAPIVLLDEVTAALDPQSEKLVQTALDRLCAGRTVIMIAHRLHTVREAHRIVVMEDGRVMETGTHDDLMRRDGRYARLVNLQAARPTESPPAETPLDAA